MKAYILKMSFEDMTPPVWRRVILPANATFNRLHQTIQFVTNFQSELSPYHSFSVEIADNFITNNESILEEYKGKKYYGKDVKQPTHMKIDSYVEKYGEFIYTYDFGDDWRIRVELEEVVDDYYFGYPTVLDGEGTAPPEDVGGPPGYEAFLKVYEDPTHPEYLSTYAWAEQQKYTHLDIANLNEHLKYVRYQKTEWQSIDHENYVVFSDKYRGSESVNIDELPNSDLIIQYAEAFVNLYGSITDSKFIEIYNAQNEPSISSSELRALVTDARNVKLLEKANALIHKALKSIGNDAEFSQGTKGKLFYVPEKKELLRYADESYYEKTSHHKKLEKMLAKDFLGGDTLKIQAEIDHLVSQFGAVNANLNGVVQEFFNRFELKDSNQLNEYVQILSMIANTTRIWENRGHTPDEVFKMETKNLKPVPTTPLNKYTAVKVGRNEPCPCGSGKKYKRCCGR